MARTIVNEAGMPDVFNFDTEAATAFDESDLRLLNSVLKVPTGLFKTTTFDEAGCLNATLTKLRLSICLRTIGRAKNGRKVNKFVRLLSIVHKILYENTQHSIDTKNTREKVVGNRWFSLLYDDEKSARKNRAKIDGRRRPPLPMADPVSSGKSCKAVVVVNENVNDCVFCFSVVIGVVFLKVTDE